MGEEREVGKQNAANTARQNGGKREEGRGTTQSVEKEQGSRQAGGA